MKTLAAFVFGVVLGGTMLAGAGRQDNFQRQQQLQQMEWQQQQMYNNQQFDRMQQWQRNHTDPCR